MVNRRDQCQRFSLMAYSLVGFGPMTIPQKARERNLGNPGETNASLINAP